MSAIKNPAKNTGAPADFKASNKFFPTIKGAITPAANQATAKLAQNSAKIFVG